ncbi:hypothetical protein M5W83_12475 [Paenibacillus thiaminolyticus]|uniref:Uncharacterized protein n=1 Tax=Paenibacillus thiaminolyticus TaxID=49283 RepID=A0ABT4FUW4_PANTH|nr:hypothetical protein [Paenibacillus thiaminolyticus]MCY9537113.1 hypothetical protein [Paenibacillus thiaminolyticus]MCY9603128.1 hypothetical protein [Paenibacillus thiaminolyticus]MCY9607958.1 hypothetical protein [Paenibacillus thiaminolyticus]MCY9613575.1 hypothetical protein [Paenibacillus thiaminolyticus]MCY9618737.1 hypothetical protein [Paenibacillus thiaminolyticus]
MNTNKKVIAALAVSGMMLAPFGAQSGHIVINGKTGQVTSARAELSYAN